MLRLTTNNFENRLGSEEWCRTVQELNNVISPRYEQRIFYFETYTDGF